MLRSLILLVFASSVLSGCRQRSIESTAVASASHANLSDQNFYGPEYLKYEASELPAYFVDVIKQAQEEFRDKTDLSVWNIGIKYYVTNAQSLAHLNHILLRQLPEWAEADDYFSPPMKKWQGKLTHKHISDFLSGSKTEKLFATNLQHISSDWTYVPYSYGDGSSKLEAGVFLLSLSKGIAIQFFERESLGGS